MQRRKTRQVKIGKVKVGGGAPISVQSMTNTKTANVKATVAQIKEVEEAGCELIRCTANSIDAAKALGEIKKEISIPLIADIHFDYRCALEAAKHVDKLRLNPGNIGSQDRTEAVVKEAKDRGLPIRIGINGGSLERSILDKYAGVGTPEGAVESAAHHIKILEDLDFRDIIVSLKFSDVVRTIKAYSLFSEQFDYPLHVGVTEAGTLHSSTIKSSVGVGHLLASGIGDTIRVSISSPNLSDEVKTGFEILKALELREYGRIFTACPTCGRTEIDLVGLANKIEKDTEKIKEPIHIAVMGCVVNGPGEAREADIGLCAGPGNGVIIKKGKVIKKIDNEKDLYSEFMLEVEKTAKEWRETHKGD